MKNTGAKKHTGEEKLVDKVLRQVVSNFTDSKPDSTILNSSTTIYIGDKRGWSKVKGKWTHRIVTYDSDEGLKFYKNGKLAYEEK